MTLEHAKQAIVRVGGGRGFVVETSREDRFVLTAAHCMHRMPELSGAMVDPWEHVQANLLARMDEADGRVPADVAYIDPISDVAALCEPDNQSLFEEAAAYRDLVEADAVVPLRIGPCPDDGPAWVLTLDGSWVPCRVEFSRRYVRIYDTAYGIRGGMSGSPVVTADGVAVAMVCTGQGGGLGDDAFSPEGFMNPCLTLALPGWLLRELMPEGSD